MRQTNTFGGRPAYYDRNPTAITALKYNAAAVAPHTVTTRATYTVPSGRKAYLEGSDGSILRDVAATTAGLCDIEFNTAGGIFDGFVYEFSTALGTLQQRSVSVSGLLAAGASVVINTADASTGGSHTFNGSTKVTEFDA